MTGSDHGEDSELMRQEAGVVVRGLGGSEQPETPPTPEGIVMEGPSLRVVIVCPCAKEYHACIAALGLSAEAVIAGKPVSSVSASGLTVFAVQAGAGKINCASTTQLIIDRFHPSLIVDAGAAGSLSDGVAINDVICVRRSFEYDVVPLHEFRKLAVELTSSTVVQELCEEHLALLQQYGETLLGKTSARFVIGDIASGEQNVKDDAMRRQLSEMLGAIACNWETSATLRTVQMNGLPSLGFRVITDNADKNMARDFHKNLGNALQVLFTFLGQFLFEGWMMQVLEGIETR